MTWIPTEGWLHGLTTFPPSSTRVHRIFHPCYPMTEALCLNGRPRVLFGERRCNDQHDNGITFLWTWTTCWMKWCWPVGVNQCFVCVNCKGGMLLHSCTFVKYLQEHRWLVRNHQQLRKLPIQGWRFISVKRVIGLSSWHWMVQVHIHTRRRDSFTTKEIAITGGSKPPLKPLKSPMKLIPAVQ